jgi:glycine C-acetyltransferase
LAELEARLIEARDARHRLVVTDGVFSMDGIVANLPGVCDLAERYDALVMVDDSHATGFMGPNRSVYTSLSVADLHIAFHYFDRTVACT